MATEVRTTPPVVAVQEEKRMAADNGSNSVKGEQTLPQGDTTEASDQGVDEKTDLKPEQGVNEPERDSDKDKAAATLIQQTYRGYRTRRQLNGCNISADMRWSDAVHRLRLEQASKQSDSGQNDSSSRWKRGKLLASQLSGANKLESSPGNEDGADVKSDGPVEGGPSLSPTKKDGEEHTIAGSDTQVGNVPGAYNGRKVDNISSIAHPKQKTLRMIEWWTHGSQAQQLSKVMEEQYWLEMVDRKHRYGSNLKYYHQAWQKADTKDNFFYWLDEGEGKHLDLEDCPRGRLDSETIIYLSSEQRKNYIVDIKEGKLVWQRNGKPVDTKRNKHKDLGDGRGIVEKGEEEHEEERKNSQRRALERGVSENSLDSYMDGSFSSSSSSLSSDADEMTKDERTMEAKHYQSKSGNKSKQLNLLNSSNWADMLLRKTIGNNTWIYVFNARHELYVGLKQTGYFQHSSFLDGGCVLSAGLLKVDNGTLTSLSPLSGHYRAGTAHFRYFIKMMQDSGVDLDRVTLSKSLLILAGMERYGKITSKAKGGNKGKKEKMDTMAEKSNKTDKHDNSSENAGGPDQNDNPATPSFSQRFQQKLDVGSFMDKSPRAGEDGVAETFHHTSGRGAFARLKEKFKSSI